MVAIYICQHFTTEKDDFLQCEEDDGSWCHCKERKGGDMVACDSTSCTTKWFHLECMDCLLCLLVNGTVQHVR